MKTQAQMKLQAEIEQVRKLFHSDNRNTWSFYSYSFARDLESNRKWAFKKTLTTITLYVL